MSNITRTIYGARIQNELLLGLKHEPVAFTTLNEKFDIAAGMPTPNGEIPPVAYLAIGMGGHRMVPGTEGAPYPEDNFFSPANGALFRHLPFVMREVGSDLVGDERRRFGMRVLRQVDGKNYICYYLRAISRNNVTVKMFHNVPTGGSGSTPPSVIITPFVPDSSNLNPIAPILPETGAQTTDGAYLSTSSVMNLDFTEQDIAELLNVGRILFKNERQMVISEMGLVAGKETVITSSANTGGVDYYEAIQATLVAHSAVYYAIAHMNLGFQYSLELGAIEPLMVGTVE